MLSKQSQIKAKYALDRLLAATMLVVLAPFYLLIALLIKLDSRGSVLFCQSRIGYLGQRFTVFKFRTMVQDADRLLDERGSPRSNRITRIGKFLRRSSLDELPQIVNILFGEMSFIGPRPGPEERHLLYTTWQQRRCEMRPGITGLAQVSGRNTLPWSRRVELDIHYVDNYSWWLDLRILFHTLRVVLTGDGIVSDRNPQQADDISQPLLTAATSTGSSNEELPVRRKEPILVGHYRKEASYEHLIKTINHSLAEQHDEELRDLSEDFPTIHIIGAPRSGTTLLSQILSTTLDIGYINNLIATHWRVPCYGIRLSEKLLAGVRPASYMSDLGRTSSIQDPHEFGYFWTYLLGYPEMAEQDGEFERHIDWDRLRRVLINMTHTFGKPVVFKSFLLAWHLKRMQQVMPKSIFLWIRRDLIDNALSIAKAREAQLGSVEKWLSIKPREYSWLQHQPVAMQLAGQIHFFERAIARQVEQLDGNNVVEISYRDLCTNPQEVIARVLELLQRNGQVVRQIQTPLPEFGISRPQPSDDHLVEQLTAAFRELEQATIPHAAGLREAS